jgi:hypothetical protein
MKIISRAAAPTELRLRGVVCGIFVAKKIAPPITRRGEEWQVRKLEDQLRPQLEFSRIEGRSVLAKVPVANVVAEAAVLTAASELRVVPRIESVSPEFES